MSFIIRKAEVSDIIAIDNELYPHLHDNHVPSREYIREVILSPDYVLAVADIGSLDCPFLVGAATLHKIVQASAGPKGYIDDLVVVPEYRREKIGQRLFMFLEEEARLIGIEKIFFTSAPRRKEANKFHLARGYILRAEAVEQGGTNYYEKKLACITLYYLV